MPLTFLYPALFSQTGIHHREHAGHTEHVENVNHVNHVNHGSTVSHVSHVDHADHVDHVNHVNHVNHTKYAEYTHRILHTRWQEPLIHIHPGDRATQSSSIAPGPSETLQSAPGPPGRSDMRIPLTTKFDLHPVKQSTAKRFAWFLTLFHYQPSDSFHDRHTHMRYTHFPLIDKGKITAANYYNVINRGGDRRDIRDIREAKEIPGAVSTVGVIGGGKPGAPMKHPFSRPSLSSSPSTPPPLPLRYLHPREMIPVIPGTAGKPGPPGAPADHGRQAQKERSTYDMHVHDASGDPRMSSKMNIDLDRLTDRVYDMLARKIRIEKERRGR